MKLTARDSAPDTASAVTVYVVEDHRLLRDGTARMLVSHGFAVVGASGDRQGALRDAARVRPQIVLLDAGLDDAVQGVSQLKEAWPGVRVVAMSFLPSRSRLVNFIRAGVAGFILKDATAAETVATIRRVAAGDPALPRALGSLLVSHVAEERSGPRREAHPGARLTRREREVIALIADGLSNKEIAERLHLATHTVKAHVHGVLEKLGLHTRLEVAAYAHSGDADA